MSPLVAVVVAALVAGGYLVVVSPPHGVFLGAVAACAAWADAHYAMRRSLSIRAVEEELAKRIVTVADRVVALQAEVERLSKSSAYKALG